MSRLQYPQTFVLVSRFGVMSWLAIVIPLMFAHLASVAFATDAVTTDQSGMPERQVAVTFDDLPIVLAPARRGAPDEVAAKLLTSITEHGVPAVGFVNEETLYHRGIRDEKRILLLRAWLDAGLELGNHTFSHSDLHTTPVAAFEDDIVRGEAVTRELVRHRRGKPPLRFFRAPFLHTGRDVETRRQLDAFLAERGYRVAPVTVDPSDWIFARAYDSAFAHADRPTMQRIAVAYVEHVARTFECYENRSRALFNHEIKQVLLLHANAMNADQFGALAHLMRRRGYRFITLDQALTDPAYESPDTYLGPGGIGWLDRWALTREVPRSFFREQPTIPAFVLEGAGIPSSVAASE